MAYLLEKSERCSMCGTAPWEWDPEQGGSKDAYDATIHGCMGCYHIKIAHQDQELMPGQSITLTPKAHRHKLKQPVPA